jgi:CDGSH-type Zn-finger protein
MPRLVRHDATGPIEIKPQEKSVWICACGLSQNLPYCDGSHKQARVQEAAGQVAIYDKLRKSIVKTIADE